MSSFTGFTELEECEYSRMEGILELQKNLIQSIARAKYKNI